MNEAIRIANGAFPLPPDDVHFAARLVPKVRLISHLTILYYLTKSGAIGASHRLDSRKLYAGWTQLRTCLCSLQDPFQPTS